MKPTRFQYFVAGRGLERLWFHSWAAGAAVWGGLKTLPVLSAPVYWLDVVYFILFIVLLWLIGWSVSVIVGWPVLGMFWIERAKLNGCPFEPGDKVLVLCGPHRNEVGVIVRSFEHQCNALFPKSEVKLNEGVAVYWPYEILCIQAVPRETKVPRKPEPPKRPRWEGPADDAK